MRFCEKKKKKKLKHIDIYAFADVAAVVGGAERLAQSSGDPVGT